MQKASKPIIVYNLNYTVFGEFPSIIAASKILNCNEKTIRRAIKSKSKILKRK